MSVIDDYLASRVDDEKKLLEHMYSLVRELVPDATEEIYYGMPAFKYRDKGLIAIVANKGYMSLYPFCDLSRLGLDYGRLDRTKGSLHFSYENALSDELLRRIVTARVKLITA